MSAGQDSADCPQLIPLVQTTVDIGYRPEEVSADKAYSSRDNFEFIDSVGAVPYIPFRSNATGKARGSRMWKKAFHCFQFNQDEFLEHYHSRSNIESTNMAVKSKVGDSVKSRNFIAQVNEVYCKLIAYNITVLIGAMYELGIQTNFA
jgi:transposase